VTQVHKQLQGDLIMRLKIFITIILSTFAIQASDTKTNTYDTCTCDIAGWKLQFPNNDSSQVIISMFDIWGTNAGSDKIVSLDNDMTPSVVWKKIAKSTTEQLPYLPFINNHEGVKQLCTRKLLKLKEEGICTNKLYGYSTNQQ